MVTVSFSLTYFSTVFLSTGRGMHWTCKFCTFVSPKWGQLLKHYRSKHGCFTQYHVFISGVFAHSNHLMPWRFIYPDFTHRWPAKKVICKHLSVKCVSLMSPAVKMIFFYTFTQSSEVDAKSAVPLSGLWLWDKCLLYF